MKKKLIVIIVVILVLAGLIIGGTFLLRSEPDKGDAVLVTRVDELMGISASNQGLVNRYAGVVEPQATLEVKLDQGRTVAEILVEEGDEVEEGDPLFRYDTEELSISLEQAKLELERMDNSMEMQRQKIAELEKEKEKVSSELQLQYTMEIQQAYADLKQAEYERKMKATEIEKTEKEINNAIVSSTISGVVRSISNTDSYDMYYGEPTSFITIVATGEYRVKGIINEQNIYTLNMDTPVVVRSRVQENQIWTGRIAEIDMENAVGNNQSSYYYYDGMAMDDTLTSSKYPFYVTLDSYEGLMLGQHVYIETGEFQEAAIHTDGVWLYEGYVIWEEDGSLSVWAENDGHIEKRPVVVGDYDEITCQYEILEGLELSDYVAWPEDSIQAGMAVSVE